MIVGDHPEDSQVSQTTHAAENIPRSALGTVSKTGEILDESGNAIGKISDSKDPQELIGNTVTSSGEIVGKTGEVLGQAILGDDESDYTTKAADKQDSNNSSNFSIIGTTKGALNLGSGLLGGQKQAQQADDDRQHEPERTQTKSETQFDDDEHDAGVKFEDHDIPTGTEHQDLTSRPKEAQDDLKDVAPEPEVDADAPKDAVSDVKDTPKDAAEDLKDTPEDVKDNLEGQDVPKAEDGAPADQDLTKKEEDKIPGDDNIPEDKVPDEAKIPGGGDEKKDDEEKKDEDKADGTAPEGTVIDGATENQEVLDDKPKEAGDVPSEIGDKQTEAGEVPSEIGDKPSEFGDKPSEIGDKPTEAGDVPSEIGDKPKEAGDVSEIGDKPTEAGDIPEQVGEEAENVAEEGEEAAKLDFSILKGTKVNKAGNLVNSNGDVMGRVVEGDVKKLLGKRADENGDIWDDAGKKVGKGEPLSDGERENSKSFAPFENFPDAVVEADGRVVSGGQQVGVVVEGDPKHLKGSKVDEDGDILDRRGNVVGKAEAWDEPEPIPEEPEVEVDRSILAGKRVNKAGNVVDSSGTIYGRVIEGNVSSMIGRMCDKQGNVRSEAGDIIGKADLVTEGEREGAKEGPFAELSGLTVSKDGKVVTPSGDVVGRLVSGDPKVLFGRSVDEDGDVVDRNGNVLAKAERWEEPVVEKKKDFLAGRKVNREGNVTDEEGNIIGKLVSGELAVCSGKEIDDDGDVVNSKGHTIGHVSRLEDIPPEPEVESDEQRKAREEQEKKDAEAEKDKKLASQLAHMVEDSLEKVRPICQKITEKIDKMERTPKEERDEEELVKQVKPLIEEGGRILTETNGAIRGMDPDGRIQRNAKHKAATRDASPEEYHLADVLKELTGTVTKCIDNAKSKIEDMPHAKKELNPLWGLLAEPLFQILAAVGLLLNGVLGLVGRLLSGLGLGGLIDNLLGGLGINRILESLGLGSVVGSLTGKDQGKKKKGFLGL